jgi:glycosyltransferase involved in cell wall biosynthesis
MNLAERSVAIPADPPARSAERLASLRVLHVHSGNLWGGVETVLVALAAERSRCPRLHPEYALCFDGPLRRRLMATGVAQHDLGEVRWRSPLRVLAARRRLGALLRSGSYDAVVTHSMWAHSLFAPVVRRSSPRLVYWAHDVMDGQHWLQRFARRTAPDLVIANSAFTAEGVPGVFRGMTPAVLYCPLSIQPQEKTASRRDIRDEFGTATDATVIVQVSRLEAWKGHEVLLDALAHLRDVPAWQCWIVGGAQRTVEKVYLESLHRRATADGIADRVRFVGQRDDIPDVLSAADVFCQPNLSAEPFGIALVEALAGGLPVVTAAIGGALEIVDASCGAVVAPRDPRALAAALRRLIENPALRRQLGSQGPARASALCDPTRQLAALASLMARAVRPSARAEHV